MAPVAELEIGAVAEQVETAAKPLSPLFWQYFLAAELSANKSRAFFETLGTSLDPISTLLTWPNLSREERNRMEKTDLGRFQKALEKGVKMATLDDFPETLSSVPRAPHSLSIWGDDAAWHAPKVAIVGTRRASTYGKAVAIKFAEALSRSGVTIVSGGALGIDAAAHEGVIQQGGRTIAVLGHGIDRVYPSSHGPLFQRIRERGLLLSQFAVGSPSLGHHFLLRNQVIAALSDVTLVIEAPERSGALSTAGASNNLGRSVFVVPGSIDRDGFRGSHGLIRDGATLVDHPDQILESMGIEPVSAAAVSDPSLDDPLLLLLDSHPKSAELLLQLTGIELQELQSTLTLLELDGKIIRDGNGFIKAP